jgi:hypothetical protein
MNKTTLTFCTHGYMLWVALGTCDTQAEHDVVQAAYDRHLTCLSSLLDSSEIEAFLTLCED